MKKYNMPDKLDELRTVPEGYAAAHMPEMLQAVSRDNMAFGRSPREWGLSLYAETAPGFVGRSPREWGL